VGPEPSKIYHWAQGLSAAELCSSLVGCEVRELRKFISAQCYFPCAWGGDTEIGIISQC
jgi:hypothetical protein